MAIQRYLLQSGITVDGYSSEDLIDRLYNDIFQYSILTDPLEDVWVSKIIIDGWDNVQSQLVNGQIHKLPGFLNERQAEEVMNRLLSESGLKTDSPLIHGNLKTSHADITVFRPPAIADGIRCIIKKRTHRVFTDQDYLLDGFAAERELNFLKLSLAHGTSILLTGLPKSGKTAFLEFLISSLPESISGIILETGRREIQRSLLIKGEELPPFLWEAHGGGADILAFNFQTPFAVSADAQVPAVIAQAMGKNPESGIQNLTLCFANQFGCSYEDALCQTCRAFPVTVFLGVLPPARKHRILAVSECLWENGHAALRPVWQYCAGQHSQIGTVSKGLLSHVKLFGAAPDEISRIKGDEIHA